MTRLRARLLDPEPGDVRDEVARLEHQVTTASAIPLTGLAEHPALHAALKSVLREMAEATAGLGRAADGRSRTIRAVLNLFRRPDLPPGSMLDI